MSEFTLKLHASDGPAWITLDEAARRSGRNLQRLRTVAAQKFEPAGLARKQPNPETGQSCWYVREDADTRFAAVRSAAVETKSDVLLRNELAADPVQLEIAKARLSIVEELERQYAQDVQAVRPIGRIAVLQRFARHLVERGIEGASEATLKRWYQRWTEGGRDVIALVDGRRVGERDGLTDQFADYFELLRSLYLMESKPAKSTVIRAANVVAHRDEIAIPHPKAAQRYLLTLERTSASQTMRYRGGDAVFTNQVLPHIPRDRTRISVKKANGTIETRAMRSDEIWCADHHVCDTLVEYKGTFIRPWLTAILDIRSNRIVGRHWSHEAPNKHNVLLALRDAIKRNGNALPDQWFVDNGKDFDAWMFQGETKKQRRKREQNEREQLKQQKVRFRIDNDRARAEGILELLKIKMVHAAPFNARSKPVERFFGIYEEQFGKLTWTYCGCNPQQKPECLAERLVLGKVDTYEDYIAEADGWIYNVHHAEPLQSRFDNGKSRDEVYAENRTSVRVCDVESLDLLLMPVEKAKVGRQGIRYRGWDYHDPALVPFFGQEVALKIDPADVTSIGVWTLGMTSKIAQVTCLDLSAWGAITDEQLAAVNSRIESIRRAIRAVSKHGGTAYANLDKQRLLSQVRRDAVETAPEPPPMPAPDSMRMVPTPVDGHSKAALPALKRAVGSELMDLSDLGEGGLY